MRALVACDDSASLARLTVACPTPLPRGAPTARRRLHRRQRARHGVRAPLRDGPVSRATRGAASCHSLLAACSHIGVRVCVGARADAPRALAPSVGAQSLQADTARKRLLEGGAFGGDSSGAAGSAAPRGKPQLGGTALGAVVRARTCGSALPPVRWLMRRAAPVRTHNRRSSFEQAARVHWTLAATRHLCLCLCRRRPRQRHLRRRSSARAPPQRLQPSLRRRWRETLAPLLWPCSGSTTTMIMMMRTRSTHAAPQHAPAAATARTTAAAAASHPRRSSERASGSPRVAADARRLGRLHRTESATCDDHASRAAPRVVIRPLRACMQQ